VPLQVQVFRIFGTLKVWNQTFGYEYHPNLGRMVLGALGPKEDEEIFVLVFYCHWHLLKKLSLCVKRCMLRSVYRHRLKLS